MKATSHFSVGLVVVSLLIAGQGCQPGAGSNPTPRATASAAQPTQGATATAQAAPATATERPPSSTATTEPQAPPNNQETIRQWAVGAAASSQMGDENWGAIQAAGAPDTLTCDDAPSAWASQNGGQEEWLEVYYEVAVAPAEVNIYQTYGATQITKVELLDTGGVYHEIYADEPSETDCPFVMQIGIADGDYEAVAVKITLDEAFLTSGMRSMPSSWSACRRARSWPRRRPCLPRRHPFPRRPASSGGPAARAVRRAGFRCRRASP